MAFRHVVNSAVAPSELSPFSSLCTALLTSPPPLLSAVQHLGSHGRRSVSIAQLVRLGRLRCMSPPHSANSFRVLAFKNPK